MKNERTFQWWNEDDVEEFIEAFIVKCCERCICADDIGVYLALALHGFWVAQEERQLEE